MKAFITKALFSKTLLITTIITCVAFSANAQTATTSTSKQSATKPTTTKPATKSPALASSYIETFFKKYKTSSDSAIDYLFGTNKLFTNYVQINLLKSKLDSLVLNIGKYEGRELISQKSAGTSLVIYSYLVKHENQPVRFIFMFYRPKDQWELYRFNYDDSMDTELIEAAKINNKK
jgi:hypothetical protein